MIDPASGPFFFDTSAESWLARSRDGSARQWFYAYLSRHRVHISAITVIERIRGYGLLWQRSSPDRREHIDEARSAYIRELGQVWPVDAGVAVIAAQIMVLAPHPSGPLRRSDQHLESRRERLARWRFDVLIAATALSARMPLLHSNPADFCVIRDVVESAPDRFPGLGPLHLIGTAYLIG